jgi:large subunit ribosomal protein L10
MKPGLRETIPEKKLNEVKELSELLKNKKTILIASIKNLPASKVQEISKKLRGKALIKLPKKNLILRAIDNLKDDNLSKMKEQIKESSVILFSDLDSFELAGELIENKSPARAKAGQEAPEDIEIQEGPTELMSGPVISDFGALGIQIKIDKGKIVIKSSKVIAKKGEKISENAASMMGKLDIKPFSVGFVPLSSFDTKERKLYLEISINKEETVKELKELFSKSLYLAVEINYASNETVSFLIGKASAHEKALEKLSGEKEEPKEKDKVDNNKVDEDKDENAADAEGDKSDNQKTDDKNEDIKQTEKDSELSVKEEKSEDNVQTSETKSEEEK